MLSDAERAAIDRALAETRRLLQTGDRHALQAGAEALNRATEEFAARRMDRGVARALTGRSVDAFN
jgi:molecular chaperone HscA